MNEDSGGDGGKLPICNGWLEASGPATDGTDAGARRKGFEPAMGVSGLARSSRLSACLAAVEIDAAPAPACLGALGRDAARLAGGGGAGAFFLPATASRRLAVFVVLASFLGGGGKDSAGAGDAAGRGESGVAGSSSYVRKKGFADFEGISFVSIRGDVCGK